MQMFTSTTMTRTHDDEKRRTHGTTILKWCFSHSMVRSAASFFCILLLSQNPFLCLNASLFQRLASAGVCVLADFLRSIEIVFLLELPWQLTVQSHMIIKLV